MLRVRTLAIISLSHNERETQRVETYLRSTETPTQTTPQFEQ